MKRPTIVSFWTYCVTFFLALLLVHLLGAFGDMRNLQEFGWLVLGGATIGLWDRLNKAHAEANRPRLRELLLGCAGVLALTLHIVHRAAGGAAHVPFDRDAGVYIGDTWISLGSGLGLYLFATVGVTLSLLSVILRVTHETLQLLRVKYPRLSRRLV